MYQPVYRLLIQTSFVFFVLTFVPALLSIPVRAAASGENQDISQEIWRIDTRTAGTKHSEEKSLQHMRFFRWQNGYWKPSDAAAFLETQNPKLPLIVFVPGWRSPTDQTTETGFHLVRKLGAEKACRIVFWDWLSEPVFIRPRIDIQHKIPVAAGNGEMLNTFVRKMPPGSKVCLFGFSFGCRIIGHACESLTQDNMPKDMRLHLVLAAAAIDQYGLAAGHRQENIPQIAEKTFISYNSQDRALRWYCAVYRGHTRVQALGRTGPPWQMIAPEFRERIEAVNLFPYIGREHRTTVHIDSPAFKNRISRYFFFE
ncbi:MAG: hypothetical protein LBH00_04975 [Planctomycetaceae bacterium]|jgi:hypothetical protein|nr:hypothetical protein [Planctomycetaceae bacterium]